MNQDEPNWRPGLRVFTAVMRLPPPKRWRLEPAKLGWSSKELVSPRGDRLPFRMKSKIEIANNVMQRAHPRTDP